jgi:hypothetical protein
MMIQQRLADEKHVRYSLGPYNEMNESEQWIRITEGCPHNCPYCYEPQEIKLFAIPEIVRNKVKIMDMNLLCKPEAHGIIEALKNKRVNGKRVRYELICGIDYRFLTPELAKALHEARFKPIRLAWDWNMIDQYKIRKAIRLLLNEGYSVNDLMVFMICNWKIPYDECCRKLDLCKVWNVRVADCWYDNQTSPNIIPIEWKECEIKTFRKLVRKHNQLVRFKIDPEVVK